MESWKELLQQKARIKAATIPRDPPDYLVAVVPHGIKPESCLLSEFKWFKCQAKHTIARIIKHYTQTSHCQVDLYSLDSEIGKLVETTELLRLDSSQDKTLVLQAVECETRAALDSSYQEARSPLRPVDGFISPRSNAQVDKTSHTIPDRFNVSWDLPSENPIMKSLSPVNIKKENLRCSDMHQMLSFASPSSPRSPSLVKVERVDSLGHVPFRYVKREASPDSTRDSVTAAPDSVASLVDSAAKLVPPLPKASQCRLLKLLEEGSPELLEAEVDRSGEILEQIESRLSGLQAQSTETQQWLKQIETLKQRNSNEQTIIGVVGNTGAGKSSVINAILDEERLVPTNCMRACTAVVTEMSWNFSQDGSEKYRAEIVFISPADWEKELRILHAEVLDGNGKVSSDAYKADSEAGIAYAKIKAVYPKKSNEDLSRSSVDDLMKEPAVLRALGQTRAVAEAQSDKFYKILQSYVDSKEKSKEDKKARKEMEYWPLIKVVKIYTKADALSTGAVIVDLPGVHDSNAARSAIAENYIKTCTGLWIVAPINRAVDDKAAKSLLGDSFKRQLKYDGTYSRVTFICSKTDDISITEASDSLGLHQVMSSKWERYDEIDLDRTQLKNNLKNLRETKTMYGDILNKAEDELEIWDKLKDDLDDGKTVYVPSVSSKRKRSSSPFRQRKMRGSRIFRNDEVPTDEDESDEEQVQLQESPQREPLTPDAILAKLAELRDMKKQARLERREVEAKISATVEEIKVLSVNYDRIEAEMSNICIAGRNEYSKEAIQQDFAAGIKELDQENQFEANEADFNPDEVVRDYAEVARSLPVFCVSSRAYQKLRGRLQRDQSIPGFGTVYETEIPQLQEHCKKLTEVGRISTCRRFLNGFSQLINSMSLWASRDGCGAVLTDAQMATEEQFLIVELSQLERQLENVVQACLNNIKEELASHIYNRFDQVVSAAVEKANDTAAKWGAPMNRANREAGGLHWCTYKAVVRRDGCFNNGILHDFNLQLTEPIIKQLGSGWETAFARRLPEVLKTFTANCKKILLSFHEKVEARVTETGNGVVGIAMLGQQLETYERIFHDLTDQMLQVITENQREANREFTPAIARQLLSAYQYCSAESGTGSFMRMKQHLTDQVDEHRNKMFNDSTRVVKTHLTAMCRQVEEHMLNRADEVFVLMRRDYTMAITGAHVPPGYEIPRPVRQLKADIAQIIREREEGGEKEELTLNKFELDDHDEDDKRRVKFKMDDSDEQLPDENDSYMASKWAASDDGQDAEDQILRESMTREEE